MKIDKSILWSFILLVVIASLYRVIPGRPFGFAPQIAMALFSGSIVKQKKYAFLLPLLSMFFSDFLYEILYNVNISPIKGFYDGQLLNYLLFAAVTVVGFFINKQKPVSIAIGSIAGASFYFITSNLAVWIGGGLGLDNLPYAKTLEGLYACFAAGVPFYKASLYATLFFSGMLFGGYFLMNKYMVIKPAIS